MADDASTDSSLGSVLRDLVATPGGGDAVPLVPGAVVGGHYAIERALGVGGMGVVYLARDQKLGRNVALKLGHILSREALARTEREGVALAQLSHPNVVVVHEVGEVDGRLFIAMEYVAGGNAREWAAAAPRTWRELALLYAAAGDGLGAAHAAGFVHRDFKPDNVLVGTDGRPRVADFGLVRSGQSGPRSADAALTSSPAWALALESSTRTGTVLGTPAYMAPEQVAGEIVGPAADQYSFCASLWEALYGSRHPARARRGVPRRLERIVARGLAADPAARWPSMEELVAAIRASTRRRRGAIAAIVAGGAIGIAIAARSLGAFSTGDAAAAAPACDPLATGAADVYVDAAATPGGTGAARCPLHTIADALALAPARGHRTIHVAAGTYDRAHGERFPLIVRGDLAIAGADDDATRIVGTGMIDHSAEGGFIDVPVRATFVIGDAHTGVALSGVTIAADAPTPEIGSIGVLCDRGNLVSRDGPLPAENAILTGLSIGPGYDQAIVVGTSARPAPIGCNLRITGSRIRGSYVGMWVAGCGGGDGPGAPVRATIGDGTDAGRNTFESIRSPQRDAMGVKVWDCARAISMRDNWFIDSDGGAAIVRHADSPYDPEVVIEGNAFRSLSVFGLAIARGVTVTRLERNWFYEIAARPAPRSAAERAVALVLDGENERVPGYPAIARARKNTFALNDVAIELRGGALRPGPRTIADFGRPGDPGENSFRCNGTAAGAAVPGYDMFVSAPSDGSGALLFAGNEWDHAPPAIARGDAKNGADIVLPAGRTPSLDVQGATTAELSCGSRVAGPAP